MKTVVFSLIIAASPVLLNVAAASESVSVQEAWDTRLAALDEERAAQTGVAVSIIFDDSGSMAEHDKMRMAKQAFRAWIAAAPTSYRFGLTALNAGRLCELKRDNKAAVLAAVNRLLPNGDTPLADTIASVGREIIQRRATSQPYERQVLVVLTDGEDNTRRGVRGVQTEMTHLRQQAVEVIAFGYQGKGRYMRGSATHFFLPDNEQDIRRGLAVIAAEVGDAGDLVVDDATRAAMSGPADAPPPTSAATATAAAAPALTNPTPSPTRAAAAKHHPSVPLLILVALIFAVNAQRRRPRKWL